ncbi:MAG: hypothetical protein ACRC6V_06530 [Bacteroidales bacterium]
MDDVVIEQDGMIVPFDFNMINDDPDTPEEEVVEEVVEEEEAEVAEEEEVAVEEVEEELSGEEEVDYEAYEITLPSGEVVVMSDLVTGYKTAEEVRSEREHVEAIKREFEEKSGNLASMLTLAQLEVDNVIAEYNDTDWDEMAMEDPATFAEHRRYLDKNIRRSEELKKAVVVLEEKKAQAENEARENHLREAVVRLQREIPGWGDPKYYALIDYGVELGASREELLGVTDPIVFLALHRAQESEKGKQAIKAKVKTVGSPKKVVKAAPKGQPASKDTQRDALYKKALSEGDHASLFNFIKD